jgi:aspartate carbamoyltransferase regulatory subunit
MTTKQIGMFTTVNQQLVAKSSVVNAIEGTEVVTVVAIPTAKKQIAAVFLDCPQKGCDGHFRNEAESRMLTIEDAGPGKFITCDVCGCVAKTPKSAFIY